MLHFKVRIGLVLFVFLSAFQIGHAQVIPTDSSLLKLFESDVLLPMIMDSAIKNSGEVRRIDNGVLMWKETTESNKKNIFSGISLLSSYNYGTNADLTTGKDNTSVNQFSAFRTNRGDRYNFGVNVQIPITSFLSRKNLIRISELQSKMAEGERDNAKLYVKSEVIRMYQDMKLAQKLVLVSSKGKQTAFINYSLTQKEFIQGNGNLDQVSRLHDIYSKASAEFETNINKFQTSYLQLQEYAGIKLSNLILQIR